MAASDEEYEVKGPDAEGRGVFMDNGFLVKAGSLARREIAPSGKSVTSVHQRLIAEGVLEEHGGQLRFVRDHLFNSPSGAAAAVLGRTANGWTSWKRAYGQTLSEVIPLLEEYCYEDYVTLGNILGDQIVDVTTSRVRHELFDDGQEDALVQGLLAPFADISTSSEALSSEESQAKVDEDDEGDES